MNGGVLCLDRLSSVPMHSQYIDEVGVLGKLRSIKRHVMAVPRFDQGLENSFDLRFDFRTGLGANFHEEILLSSNRLNPFTRSSRHQQPHRRRKTQLPVRG